MELGTLDSYFENGSGFDLTGHLGDNATQLINEDLAWINTVDNSTGAIEVIKIGYKSMLQEEFDSL